MGQGDGKEDEIEEDDDDCVIFEGSPLYASLVQSGSLAEELGYQQFGSATSQETHQQADIKVETDHPEKACGCRKWSSVTGVVKTLCQRVKSWFLPDVSDVYRGHLQTVIDELSGCVCLEDDDRDFIDAYVHNSPKIVGRRTPIRTLISDVLAFVIAAYVYQYLNQSIFKKPLPWYSVVIFTLAGLVLPITFREGRRYIHSRKCKKLVHSYEDFIQKNEHMAAMVKKCLRLIQETELITRGFTLVSQRNPLSRLEGGQKDTMTRQCPVLRKLVFTVARETVLVFRQITKTLFDTYPMSTELDIKGTYLAYEPIQSYGPCLQVDVEDVEQLFTVTDGFSVSALKGISHLSSLHQSEFIKALILIQYDRIEKGKDHRSSHIEFAELEILDEISSRLDELTTSLQKSHHYHSCAWMNREPVKMEPVSRKSRSQSDMEGIYVAVHSLDLHLQAALTRVKYLSDLVQSLSDTEDTCVPIEEFMVHMQPIKAELESSKGCWEESITRIEKAAEKASPHDEEIPLNDGQACSEETQKPDRPARNIEDYIIEDQVFEGYTDSGDLIADYEWELPLTPAEKEKKKKEKEEALRMLSELKSVISVRAADTEHREKVALSKMYPQRISEGNIKTNKNKTETCTTEKITKTVDSSISNSNVEPDTEKTEKLTSNELSESSNIKVNSVVPDNNKVTLEIPENQNEEETTVEVCAVKEDDEKNEDYQLTPDVLESIDLCSNGNKSIVTGQGVRRLRKSHILDLSDSDVEDYPNEDCDSEQYTDDNTVLRLGLPLTKSHEHKSENETVDGNSDAILNDDFKFRLPMCSLQERLKNLSGANLGMSSEIAEQAVARSRMMGLREETMFGGEVYGECSSSDDNSDDDS